MKSKLLIIVMSVVLFVNSYDLRVFANTDYDHNELLDYPGYSEAMYETIVEQTSFISGRYTENKDYVNESINQITDYAKGWWDEYKRISNMEPKEKIREMINAAGGYALTVSDFIKNLFTDYDTSLNANAQIDFSSYEKYLKQNNLGDSTLFARPGYVIEIAGVGTNLNQIQILVGGDYENWEDKARYWFIINGILTTTKVNTTKAGYSAMLSKSDNLKYQGVNGVMNLFHLAGVSVVIKDTGGVKMDIPIRDNANKNVRDLKNYVKDNSPQLVIPQPKAYLSCPDGTKIGMTINGSTFLDVNGQVMQVSKDGTANVSSQICNLGWEKPTIQYVDGTDKVGITTPDGKTIDAETGEPISGEFDDSLEGCDGVLCAIGKLLSGLGSIVKAIAAVPLKILDGLFELIKKVVVPPDGYWTEQIDDIEKQFFKDEIKENIDSLKDLGGASSGQFQDVSVSLMGVDNVTVVDSDSINMSLDTIHGWVRGIFYPLLLFFNISMLYRLIRGTSFVGIGETKGGGDK